MSVYRTGSHWGTTIIREGAGVPGETGRRPDDELVAVVANGDTALAQRICALLNADDARTERSNSEPAAIPPAASNPHVEINAGGRHIIVEAPGDHAALLEVALATWKATDVPDRKTMEAGSGFQVVERAAFSTYTDGYPGSDHGRTRE